MMSDDLTLAVLREIRDEIRTTNQRLDETRSDLSRRLDETNERLGTLEGAMTELAHQQRFVVHWLKAGTKRDRALERRVDALEARTETIEAKLSKRRR